MFIILIGPSDRVLEMKDFGNVLCAHIGTHQNSLSVRFVNAERVHRQGKILVLVSNENMYIDIKPYFYLAYRSILNYFGMRCFPGIDLPNSFMRFSSVLKREQI